MYDLCQKRSLSLSVLTAIFPGEPGLAVSVRRATPTNQQPMSYRPDDLPVAQPTVSEHWRKKYHIPRTCLPQAHLEVFKLCIWPLKAPGYLGGGCHASHQPSDASIPVQCYVQTVLFEAAQMFCCITSPLVLLLCDSAGVVCTMWHSSLVRRSLCWYCMVLFTIGDVLSLWLISSHVARLDPGVPARDALRLMVDIY